MLKHTVAGVAVLGLLGTLNAATAQQSPVMRDDILAETRATQHGRVHREESVGYEDLNLSSPAGVRALYRRIDVAAKKVCAPLPDIRNAVMREDWEACYEGALDRAVGSAGIPALNRYHLVQTGRIGEQRQLVTRAH